MPARRVTISDVARRAGVSPTLVSFALNDRPGVSPVTRERILAAAAALGWSPSHRARALSTSRSFTVGLVIARNAELLAADPFFALFIAGLESVLGARGYSLLLRVVASGEAEQNAYRRLAAEGRVDAVLLTDIRVRDRRPALLREVGLPAVAVGRLAGPQPLPRVVLDDRTGVTAAVEHLLSLGHRRIAHVSGPRHFIHGMGRRRAWQKALERAGVAPGPCIESDFTAGGGAKATHVLLDEADPPTAIVYANDLMAIAGIAAAASRGIAVPDQLSVTGFDDTELAGYLTPPLTTVRTDIGAWGRATALTALALIEGEQPDDVDLPSAELIIRGSTAPPRNPDQSYPSRKDVR